MNPKFLKAMRQARRIPKAKNKRSAIHRLLMAIKGAIGSRAGQQKGLR